MNDHVPIISWAGWWKAGAGKHYRHYGKVIGGKAEDNAGLLQEYGRVLRDHCRSDAHVEAVVNELMRTLQRCPAPAEIVEAAGRIQDAAGGDGLPDACDVCRKTGGAWVC